MSLYCVGKHTPIAGILAHRVIELLGPGPVIVDPNRLWWKSKLNDIMLTENFELVHPTTAARVLYEEKYGISISDQLAIEDFIVHCNDVSEIQIPYSFMQPSSPALYY